MSIPCARELKMMLTGLDVRIRAAPLQATPCSLAVISSRRNPKISPSCLNLLQRPNIEQWHIQSRTHFLFGHYSLIWVYGSPHQFNFL
ncbi:unnamed protein product [Cuscuta epithymum]|uniref:Uncharacterized protein n=1 Tax=Cuscuta epithymum TaxID=186058 RepID=A0AAV0DZ54_9ASTE|nr:unnamed protein product [Cuscuta epithymum]